MNRFLKLVNFEFNRIANVFFTLLALVLVMQIVGEIIDCNRFLGEANYAINEKLLTRAEFLSQYGGPINMVGIARSLWFLGSIALCATAVGFYIFLIWYRDWFGKNTFIYRLLMLPTSRLNVLLAKIITILLMTFGFVAFQLILLPIESTILKGMVPEGIRTDLTVTQILEGVNFFKIVIPQSFIEFLLYYSAGLVAVAVLFTAILFERSYRMRGIFMGLGYGALAVLIFILPLLLQIFVIHEFFYPIELFLLMVFTGLVVFFGSIWMSKFLLNQKIRV